MIFVVASFTWRIFCGSRFKGTVSSSLAEEGNVTDVDISGGIETVPGAKDGGAKDGSAMEGNVGAILNIMRFF